MRTDLFDYKLPCHLIAQEPCQERDQARLLAVNRADAAISHHVFHELPNFFAPGDLVVLNDTRVVPARLVGRRERTGGRWEGLFLRPVGNGTWELMCQTRGRPKDGETVVVEPGSLRLTLLEKSLDGHWLVRPSDPDLASFSPWELLERHGRVPLPPYIRRGQAQEADRQRYQTVFARRPGAVAAPTAGLHFTPLVFDGLKRRGISWTFLTLHVGLGTFQPIQVEDVAAHQMHREWGELSAEAAAAITACRTRSGRVVAVGTTTVRVLETVAASGPIRPWSGETQLYIYPSYQFRAVDALVTNFHLPRTSLLVLVSAFAGMDLIRRAYSAAIENEYRFYSYGDAMLIR